MPKVVLALAARSGVGKDTFCDWVEQRLAGQVTRIGMSARLRTILETLSLPTERKDYSHLVEVLEEGYGTDFLVRAVMPEILASPQPIVVIDALRMIDAVVSFRSLMAERDIPTVLVHVSASIENRVKWTREREEQKLGEARCTRAYLMKVDKLRTEREIPRLRSVADVCLVNNRDLYYYCCRVEDVIHRYLVPHL